MTGVPTLATVAAMAGVSPATASRVLTGSARVSPEVRDRVQSAIEELGYVRRRARRSMEAATRSGAVAVVICQPPARFFGESFFARLVSGAEEELAAHGRPLLVLSASEPTITSTGHYLTSGAVAGVVLVSASGRHPLTVTLPAAGVPVRCAGRPGGGLTAPFVDADNPGGARQVAEHLVLSGRRRAAVIAGPPDLPASADRLSSFVDTLTAAGLPTPVIAYGDFSLACGAHAMSWLLHRAPDLDAVFTASDSMAVGALQALRRAGRKVPDDVAVIGFDDAPLADQARPRLTTVRQPIEELGATAARLLVAQLDGAHDDDLGNPVLPTELIARDSS